ncbi:MAG: heavy metal translocating P-type ATPase [Lachnospiraceae bacterium]
MDKKDYIPEHHHEHHEHSDSCGCGHEHHHEHHEHSDSCSCGHEHHHEHHEHADSCSCGHEHHHEHHEHADSCSCGHEHHHEHHHIKEHPADCDCELCHPHEDYCDVCGESLSKCTCNMPDATNKKRVFILENLGCANCAAKMEAKIKALPEVDYATITFATKQLRVSAKDPEALLPTLQSICSSIEPEVIVKPRKHKVQKAAPVPETSIISSVETSKKSFFRKENMELITIITGAILFILGEILHETVFQGETFPPILIALCLIAYIILGWKIILTAVKNLLKGQIFDENFLMTIATLGALAIQNYMEAVGVILFFRVGEYFEHRAVENSRKSIMDAIDMRPEVVHLLVGEQVKVINAEEAIVGDILLVRPGDRIPLDGIIIEGESQIDTSPVTGEPVPVFVHTGDEIISGCMNHSGLLKMRVEKPLEESMVTRILDSVENAAASKPQMERFITKFARIYTPFVVLVAVLTAIIPSLNILPIFPNGGDWNFWIHTALTFLVISCPCALVLSVPLAFFSGLGAGSKKGILFKGGSSLEAIKNITTVIMDKTGTITRGDFRVQKVIPVSTYSETEILSYCASCELNSTHPIGNSIIEYAKDTNISISRPSCVEEIAGKGIKAELDGKEILCGNQELMKEYKIDTSKYLNDIFGTEVFIAVERNFIGYLIISDTIKPEAKAAIADINSLNIHTVILTGDGENGAKAVAKETGIKEVHAKLLPQDKLSKLQKIREQKGAVMFVGDGINDAPVLAGADVGAAMGSGADAAIEAADIVFMNSNLISIPESIQIAKDSSNAATQNVVFALIIKAMVMVLGLTGHANMWFAVFADSGVAVLCVLNSIRVLYKYRKKYKNV